MCIFVSHLVAASFLVSPVPILVCTLALSTMDMPDSLFAIAACCNSLPVVTCRHVRSGPVWPSSEPRPFLNVLS